MEHSSLFEKENSTSNWYEILFTFSKYPKLNYTYIQSHSNQIIFQVHLVQSHSSFLAHWVMGVTSCLTGNTITCLGLSASPLLVPSLTMSLEYFFLWKHALSEEKRLLGRNSTPWSREFKKRWKKIKNHWTSTHHAWHWCTKVKIIQTASVYQSMHNRQIDIHTYFSIINAIDLISYFSIFERP